MMDDKLRTLHELIDSLSERGDKPALVALQKEEAERWTYRELADEAGHLGRYLLEAGVGPGDRVGMFAENRPEWVAACLGAIRAGAVAVPVDVQHSKDALTHVLNDSGIETLFTTSRYTDRLDGLELNNDIRRILLDGDEEFATEGDGGHSLPDADPEDVAALFYTSGTTGPPKGVPLSHRNLTFQLKRVSESDLVTPDDRVLLPLPLHHVYPFVIGMLTPLAHSVPIVTPHSLTGPEIVRALNEGEVTIVIGVPKLYRALFEGIMSEASASGTVASTVVKAGVRVSTTARQRLGVPVGKVLLEPIRERFGPHLRLLASGGSALDPELGARLEGIGWDVAIGYGLTETSPLLTIKRPGEGPLDSVGKPIKGIELRIDTEDSGSGEILARGPAVFKGYHNLPDATEEVLPEDGWFRTGDLGFLDDEGYLHVEGRASTLIVTEGGENVQPDEVEDVYAEHPAIKEIGVLERDGGIAGLIVPSPGAARDGDLRDVIRAAIDEQAEKLASYQRISDFAVTRQSLPRTRLGKIRRHELEERFEQAKQEEDGAAKQGPISLEEMSGEDRDLLTNEAARATWDFLAERFSDVPLTPDTSPSLDLAVDSLEWVDLTLEISRRTGAELDEEALGRIETVRDLLGEVTESAGGEGTVSPVENPDRVLSDEQKRWLQPLGPVSSAAAHAFHTLIRAFMGTFFRFYVDGLENLPVQGSCVIVPNHRSYLDPFALVAAMPFSRLRETHWGGLAPAVFTNPIKRFFGRLAQAVPIDPQRGVLSSLAFGAAILERDRALVWYPEGGRSKTGELQPFRPGIGRLLDRFDVPIVPVFVHGTYEAMPWGAALPKPGRVHVVFGEPVRPSELAVEAREDERPQRIVEDLHDRVAQLGAREST